MNNSAILVVIPARGGSKGIPRKNLRSLAGKPLLHYSILTALNSCHNPDVFVSTDDDEIASISEQLGASIIHRDPAKAEDATTLDPVIHDAFIQATAITGKDYKLIVTLQPTSPLLSTSSLDDALSSMVRNPDLDTIISAKDDTHLTWRHDGDSYKPNYDKRVNRQYLPQTYKETGGFLITRTSNITETNRIGNNVALHLLSNGEDIDIDTYEDWNLCEYYLKRKRLLFVVSGYPEIGLGHAYNTLLIANDILNHQIEFLVDTKSQLARDKIAEKNYTVQIQTSDDIADDVIKINPDVVINDRLDTSKEYIQKIKDAGIKTINFEDLGDGARLADLVINAIYPENTVLPKHHFGHEYFILRDEFFLTKKKLPSANVTRVLLTFGGVDPNNLTCRVLKAIQPYCRENDIAISVVAGFGYSNYEKLNEFEGIDVFRNCTNISHHMQSADIIFTSAGRTTYEVASLQVPSIVIAQNPRELTHFFASAEYGFLNLGLGNELQGSDILEAFISLAENQESRIYMADLMAKTDLASGRKRTLKLINDVVEQA
jgi:CMP-N-acetylneuraminic acid synthetase